MSTRLFAISVISGLVLSSIGCSQPEQSEQSEAAQSSSGYVSENQQFVEQLDKEVTLDNPDELLTDLEPSTPSQP